jgi:hypothetical protein
MFASLVLVRLWKMRELGLVAVQTAFYGNRRLTIPFAVLPQLATSDIALGSLYAVVAAIEAFGVYAAVKVRL